MSSRDHLYSRLVALLRLGKRSGWLSLLVWLAMVAPALAELELRVAVEQDASQVRVGSSTPAVLRDPAGQVLGELPANSAIELSEEAGRITVGDWQAGAVWVEPDQDGLVYIGDNWYRGRVLVVRTGSGLTAVNYVDLEQYLYSVVGGEMPTNWNLEALKSQAVAARSYVLYQRQSNANTVFDVGDTTRWQVYEGIKEEAPSTRAAVDQTRGQVLTYNGQIIEAVFHSSSGGRTENVEDVWSSPLPYLRSVQDYDQIAPVYQWSETIPADRLRQLVTGVGNIISMVPEETTPNGRIVSMRVVGDAGTRTISGNDLRSALNLRSTLFSVVPQMGNVASANGAVSLPHSFQIVGRGFGHGLGMSQWGALGLAQQGYNYQQILTHYYTGAVLSVIRVE
ncbi:MAG TPA: SpoIID/LytB domain-containing protein [Chroococcidiopsis sp.]